MPTDSLPPGSHVLIAGLGLIGGSIALAVRRPGVTVTALVRDRSRYERAVDEGVVDAVVDDPGDAASVTLAVVCTPVDAVVDTLAAVEARHPQAILTDAGSTKATIVAEANDRLQSPDRFVAAHPLAGSEQSGWAAAQSDLFTGRTCVLTPAAAGSEALRTVRQFWIACGFATLHETTPEQHDRDLAQTSHLPHLVAAALVNAVNAPVAMRATGYADTTRIAAGDAELWTAIVRENRQPVRDALALLQTQLSDVDQAIGDGDFGVVRDWLARAAAKRRSLRPPTN